MLLFNKEKNSCIFNEEDYKLDHNYIPLLFKVLLDTDGTKTIHFAIDLPETPMLFMLYFRKVLKESDADLRIYHRENSQPLRDALRAWDIPYYNLKDFPDYVETSLFKKQTNDQNT